MQWPLHAQRSPQAPWMQQIPRLLICCVLWLKGISVIARVFCVYFCCTIAPGVQLIGVLRSKTLWEKAIVLGPMLIKLRLTFSRVAEDDDHHLLASGQTTPHPSMIDRRLPSIPTIQQVCISPFKYTFRSRLPALPHFLTTMFKDYLYYSEHSYFDSHSLSGKAPELTLTTEHEKETPPPTPRGTASTGSTTCDGTTLVSSKPSRSRSVSGTSSPTNSAPAPHLATPIGRLLVRVDTARGIRNSRDPYFVCTFESNEFISKGPKKEDESQSNTNGQPMGAPSRGGGGISIPMRHRHSPGAHGITDPSWGHEALL